ncbi:hypothetical protein ACIQF6_28500 [Kitasatospora sp. NPDC092948]|uniref:hypothetical protein n=1 Tax=Kitasatospora sp. NPDC092948 TaxID=3364088 RepID=UPI00380CA22A
MRADRAAKNKQRYAEHWSRRKAADPTPRGLFEVAFDQLRATLNNASEGAGEGELIALTERMNLLRVRLETRSRG